MSILKQKEDSHDTHVAREAAIEAALAIPPDKGVKRCVISCRILTGGDSVTVVVVGTGAAILFACEI